MRKSEREYIIYWLDSGKESPVRRFLETKKLDDTQALVRHLFPYLGDFEDIGIAKVQFDRTRSVDRLTDIAKKQHVRFWQFR